MGVGSGMALASRSTGGDFEQHLLLGVVPAAAGIGGYVATRHACDGCAPIHELAVAGGAIGATAFVIGAAKGPVLVTPTARRDQMGLVVSGRF